MRLDADLTARLAETRLQAEHRWSARQQSTLLGPPGISYTTFIAILWTGFSLALVFLLCRLLARFMGPRRLFMDDAFAMFAFALVTVTAALWQWAARDMYYILDFQAGLAELEPDFLDRLRRWLRVSLAVELCFYTSLVSVKLALLMFFRRLGNNVSHFGRVWWPVLVLTLATYVASVGTVHYECLVGPVETILGYCNEPSAIRFNATALKVNCALDVLTDFLIMLVPIFLLRKVRIPTAKKLAFCGLFSLSVVTMTIAVVRTADLDNTRREDGQLDTSYLWMWSALEPCVAVVVACLSAFPQLFAQSREKRPAPYKPSDTHLRIMSRIRSSRNKNSRPPGDDTLLGLDTMDREFESMPPIVDHDDIASRDPVLVPGARRPAVAHVRSVRGRHGEGLHQLVAGPHDRITQRLEYRVDRNFKSEG